MIQVSYQHLDSLSFNLVNQTKMFFTATFVWIFIGKKQSVVQCGCLLMLMAATAILGSSNSKSNTKASESASDDGLGSVFWLGFVPCLAASVCSGISSALSQRTLQKSSKDQTGAKKSKGRNSLLFSLELSFCSALVLVASLVVQQFSAADKVGNSVTSGGLHESLEAAFVGFTPYTLVPPLLNACGGVVVGMVIKYAGGVRKGFATTVGILLTGVFEYVWNGTAIKGEMVLALPLVVVSSVVYTRFPYKSTDASQKQLHHSPASAIGAGLGTAAEGKKVK